MEVRGRAESGGRQKKARRVWHSHYFAAVHCTRHHVHDHQPFCMCLLINYKVKRKKIKANEMQTKNVITEIKPQCSAGTGRTVFSQLTAAVDKANDGVV